MGVAIVNYIIALTGIYVIFSIDPGSGLLKFSKMQEMFQDKGYDQECALLIFSFLHQYDVLLPVDKETALVPSMISPIPVVR